MSYDEVLQVWFGDLDAEGKADAAHRMRWFRGGPEFDEELRRRFGALHEQIARGEREDWLRDDLGRLATVIVLDQFSRNLFRGTPRAFAQDARALEIASESLSLGVDQRVGPDARAFLYMPFMHAEDLAAQERCVALFAPMGGESLRFAEMHRDIVARFGRFPHRNAILGRPSTDEELAFLKQPNSSF